MIDVKIIKKPKSGRAAIGGGIATAGNSYTNDSQQTLADVLNFNAAVSRLLQPYDANNQPLAWAQATDPDGDGGIKAKTLRASVTFASVGDIVAYQNGNLSGGTGGGGLDITALESYLTTNGYATQDWVSAHFNDYVLTKAAVEAVLTGNITSHTHDQYLTAHQSLANYYTKAEVNTELGKYLLSSAYTAADILTKIKTVDGAGSGLDADMLDGYQETSFFRTNRGGIPAAYIDLTTYTSDATDYANYESGTYIIRRTGYSELFANLALNAGSTSALQFKTSYNDDAALYFRKACNSTHITGPWRTILTELNVHAFALTPSNYAATLDRRYYTESEINAMLTNGSVTKVGTATIGSAAHPIYLNAGTPTACGYSFGNATGNAALNNGTLNVSLNADMLDGVHGSSYLYATCYCGEQKTGVLVKTDVPAQNSAMFTVHINGNSYHDSTIPIDTYIQFYNYPNYNQILNWTAINNGANFGAINVFIYEGYVCLWFPQQRNYMTFNIFMNNTNSNALRYNRVISATNTTMPTEGVTRLVTITPYQSALTTDNVASATKLQTARTLWGQSFDGTDNVAGTLSGVEDITFNANAKIAATDNHLRLLTKSGGTQGLAAAQLLASDLYADWSKVPANGIYSKGDISTGGAIKIGGGTITWDAGNNAFMFSHTVASQGDMVAFQNGNLSGGSGGGGLDITALESYLTTNGYATQDWVAAHFNDYVLTKAAVEAVLTGNITTHTHNQYLTEHQSLANYYTKTEADGKYLTAINKSMVEAVLTGNITTHTHSQYLTAHQSLANYMTRGEIGDTYQAKSTALSFSAAEGYVTARFTNTALATSAAQNYIELWGPDGWFNLQAGHLLAHGAVTATSFVKTGGTATQFLKADGSVDSNSYLLSSANAVSASKLATPHTLWGQSFDGTDNVAGTLSGVEEIIFNANARLTAMDNALRFFTKSGGAQGIQAGNLLISNLFSDANKVPENGIYSKDGLVTDGSIKIGGGTITWDEATNSFIFSHTVASQGDVVAFKQ